MKQFFNEKVLPGIMKFINTKGVQSIKNGMVYSMPLLIVGSIFLILSNFPVKAVTDALEASGIKVILDQAYGATFNISAMIAVIGISYTYVKLEGQEPLSGAMIALSTFLLFMPSSITTESGEVVGGIINKTWTAGQGMIGAIIMVHGDDNGLVLPPRIAPTQVIVIPVQQQKEGVLDKANELFNRLSNFRVKVDDTDKSPGWKFSECEMRGIPLRVEIGPKDLEKDQAVLARRDTHEKIVVSLGELEAKVEETLNQIQKDMLERARAHRDAHTHEATEYQEFVKIINEKPGFVKAMWCCCRECEDKIKEETAATSRCMPYEQEQISDVCVCCGKPAKKLVFWGKAY